MALTHVAQTFNADPFLRLTQYDTVAKTAVIMTMDTETVARPSVVKFTKDQNSLLVVTDRVPAGVKVLLPSGVTATNVKMSDDGRTFVETTPSGFNFWAWSGVGYKKVNALVDDDYELIGIGPLGDYIILGKGATSCKIYKKFASSFVMDHEFAVGTFSNAFLAKDILLYRTSANTNTRQLTIYGYTDAALFTGGGTNLIVSSASCFLSATGKFVVARGTSVSGSLPTLITFALSAGLYGLQTTDVMSGGTFFDRPVVNTTEDRILCIHLTSGTTMKVQQWLLATSGVATRSTALVASTTNWTSGFAGFLAVPPHNPNNKIILIANGTTRAMPFALGTYSIPSPASAASPGTTYTFVSWIYSDAGGTGFAVKVGSGIEAWSMGSSSEFISLTENFPLYDPDFPITNGATLVTFSASMDGERVAYVHSDKLFAGTQDSVSPLGTYISRYAREAASWELVGVVDHPAGYTVKNVAFRGVDGSAVSYFLTNGPDNAIEGRYIYDGSTGSELILEPTGEIVDPALTNTFLEYGWDDYFVATYDYSDARPSSLKLYQFGSLAMDFSEKDSIDIVFGPLTLTNCWDIIVANGPLSNPFTMYKREGDEIVTQAPLSIEWFEEYGTIVDMVALDDCTGFIVVTDEDKVIVIDVPPVDPEDPEERPDSEIVDIVELDPEIDEELIDEDEPPPEQEEPNEPPEEIELDPLTGQLVVTYPPNPQGPPPGGEGVPNQPSAPIFPPIPVPLGNPAAYPPGTIIFPPPGIPNPPQMVTDPTDGGGGLIVIARTARVSLNISYER